MTLVVLLVIAGLIIGGISFVVEGLLWLLAIAAAFVLAGIVLGAVGGRKARQRL